MDSVLLYSSLRCDFIVCARKKELTPEIRPLSQDYAFFSFSYKYCITGTLQQCSSIYNVTCTNRKTRKDAGNSAPIKSRMRRANNIQRTGSFLAIKEMKNLSARPCAAKLDYALSSSSRLLAFYRESCTAYAIVATLRAQQ